MTPESSASADLADTKSDIQDVSSLSDLFSPLELGILDQIGNTGGFRLQARPKGSTDAGFATDLQTRTIYFDPKEYKRLAPFRRLAVFAHELGHHTPDVMEFQDACTRLYAAGDTLLPQEITPKRRQKMLHMVENVLGDILLESTTAFSHTVQTGELLGNMWKQNRGLMMIEEPENLEEQLEDPAKATAMWERERERMESFEQSNRRTFPWDAGSFEGIPAYNQHLNVSLVAPFFDLPDPQLVAPDVATLYPNMQRTFDILTDPRIRGGEKSPAFIQFVSDFGLLLQREIDRIRDEEGDPAQAFREFGEELDRVVIRINGIAGSGRIINVADGKEGGEPIAVVQGQMGAKIFGRQGLLNEVAVDEIARELDVPPEVYRKFLETCAKYDAQIQRMTEVMTRFVLRDYMPVVRGGQRQGFMIEPGREVETFQRMISGEIETPTWSNNPRQRSPRSLQLYKLIDTSSSMIGDIDGTLGYYTVFAKSSFNIQEELRTNAAKYQTKPGNPSPLELEVTCFDNVPHAPMPTLTPAMTLKSLVQGFHSIMTYTKKGGGTNDAAALQFEYGRVRAGDYRSLKVLSMITDGFGQQKALDPILEQIKGDPDIYFLVHGIGEGGGGVKQTYEHKFLPRSTYRRLYADESATTEQAIEKTIIVIEEIIQDFFT